MQGGRSPSFELSSLTGTYVKFTFRLGDVLFCPKEGVDENSECDQIKCSDIFN